MTELTRRYKSTEISRREALLVTRDNLLKSLKFVDKQPTRKPKLVVRLVSTLAEDTTDDSRASMKDGGRQVSARERHKVSPK